MKYFETNFFIKILNPLEYVMLCKLVVLPISNCFFYSLTLDICKRDSLFWSYNQGVISISTSDGAVDEKSTHACYDATDVKQKELFAKKLQELSYEMPLFFVSR